MTMPKWILLLASLAALAAAQQPGHSRGRHVASRMASLEVADQRRLHQVPVPAPALATISNSLRSFFFGGGAQEQGLEMAPAVAVREATSDATIVVDPVNLGNAVSFTILAKAGTLNPKPSTLDPKPSTLNPQP